MSEQYPYQRRNTFAFGLDYVAFVVGINFISPTTVLPAFLARLGASTVVIGLLVTVFHLSAEFPQIVAGNAIARRPLKKPILVRMALVGRPVIALLAILLFVTNGSPAWAATLGVFVALAVLFVTDSFAAIAWMDILGRAFPAEKRGGIMAGWQIVKGVAVLGVAVLVQQILSNPTLAFPRNYALLFAAGFGGLVVSAIAMSGIKELPPPIDEPATTHIAWRDFGPHVVSILRDANLRQVTLVRVLLALGTMASPFYVLYATDKLGLPEPVIALFILAQTAGSLFGSLLLGRIADRHGARRAIQASLLITTLAPMLALGISGLQLSTDVARPVLFLIYVVIGVAENVGLLGFLNYILDASPAGQRSIYLGTSNTIASLGVIGPVFAGWLLGISSYPVLFIVTLVFAAAALLLGLRLPVVRVGVPAREAS